MKEVLIPEKRVAVLIGSDGETREEIEELTECSVEVEDNVVKIDGEAIDEMTAEQVVKAIGRGFPPEKAFKLIERDFTFHIMDVKDYADTQNSRERLKGRVIGRDGEARRHIEKMTETDISVFGSTIGIIGNAQNIEIAREALRMLLQGSSHATAYSYLEKNQDRVKR